MARDILDGAAGPKRDAVLMNAGAALHVALGTISIEEGISLAEEMIDSGKAKQKLEDFVSATKVAMVG